MPATAVFLSLASPTVNLLFGHGQGSEDADWVGWALMAFAVGLIPFTVQFVCLRTFYAMEDTRTPFLLQIGIAAVNAGGAILFVWWVDDPTLIATALALSYSLAYFVGVFVSWQLLRRKLPTIDGGAIGMHIVRLGLGAVPGAVAAFFFARFVDDWLDGSFWGQLLSLAVGGVLILACTLGIGKLLKIREMGSLSQLLRRGRGRDKAPVEAVVADDDPPTTIRPRPALPGEFHEEMSVPRAAAVVDAVDEEDEVDDEPPAPLSPESPEPMLAGLFRDEHDDPPTRIEAAAPDEDDWEDSVTEIVPTVSTFGEPNMVLGVRYQLGSCLVARSDYETWLAHDQVLSRDVIIHAMRVGDPDGDALLNAARRGAAATDSRFLRVLDVDRLDDDGPIGVYVVCEYAQGTTLSELLTRGPLNDQDGAFIAREVAEALAPMHAQGIFHERLDPDHLLITPAGGVRIMAFGVASALLGSDVERPWSRREADDVIALGAILRATQSGEWDPGDDPG
ncbi:MAG: hypothetical protein GX596_01015, partial [Propionibacterium sp.]|nr:hypothetical protein [Propionibacterium sp.]